MKEVRELYLDSGTVLSSILVDILQTQYRVVEKVVCCREGSVL